MASGNLKLISRQILRDLSDKTQNLSSPGPGIYCISTGVVIYITQMPLLNYKKIMGSIKKYQVHKIVAIYNRDVCSSAGMCVYCVAHLGMCVAQQGCV